MSFRDELSVKTNSQEDLLDPEKCRREDIISNILIYLGAKKEIAQNPIVGYEVGNSISRLLIKQGKRKLADIIDELRKPTKNDVLFITHLIRISMKKANEEEYKGPQEQLGIGIDDEGNICVKSIEKNKSGKTLILNGKYELDSEGNLVVTEEINPTNDSNQAYGKIIQTYNKYGGEMKTEDYSTLSVSDDGKKHGKMGIVERIKGYPFIAERRVENYEVGEYTENSFVVLAASLKESLEPCIILNESVMNKLKGINLVFDDEKEAVDYFMNHRPRKNWDIELKDYLNRLKKIEPRKKRLLSARIRGLCELAKKAEKEVAQ